MAVGALLSNAIGLIPAFPTPENCATLQGRTGGAFKAGAPLKRSSGTLVVAGADNTADIVGVAAHPVAGSGELARFYPCEGVVFEATLENQSAMNHALVITNMHVDYGLQVDSNGVYYVDVNETSNTCVNIVGPRNDADITAAKIRARVLVRFLQDTLASYKGIND